VKRALALLLSLSLVGVNASTAYAEPTAADKETARGLMAEGRDKREKGDHKGALEAFRAAHKIMNVPTTGLELGREQIELGMLIEARDTLLAVARTPAKPGEAEAFGKARDEAEKLAESIAPRLASAKINAKGLPDGAEAEITIDGVAVSGVLGVARKMNPGDHTIVVRAKGLEKSTDFKLTEGETKEIEVDFTTAKKSEGPIVEHPPDKPSGGGISPLAVTGFVIAGVGLVVGGVTGVMHLSKTSDLKDRCPNGRCGPDTYDDYDSAKTLGTISTISFAVAGAGAVVGVIGLLSSSKKTETAGVHVYVTGNSLGLYGAF
jgi:hypothetical protein